MAVYVIQDALFGNSNWQIGQTSALASTAIAHEGHSFVFTAWLNSFG